MPEGFKPLGAQSMNSKLTHSEGKIMDELSRSGDGGGGGTRAGDLLGDSSHDIVSLGPGDSVSQMGTLRKELHVVQEGRLGAGKNIVSDSLESSMNDRVLKIERGMSIGSGISLEIAQNIPQDSKSSVSILCMGACPSCFLASLMTVCLHPTFEELLVPYRYLLLVCLVFTCIHPNCGVHFFHRLINISILEIIGYDDE